MRLEHQGNLLTVMEDGRSTRVGGLKERMIDVRYIALTNKPPRMLIQEGLLREDLYNRLRGMELRLPPLRDRIEDVALLVDHFLEKLNLRPVVADARSTLEAYHWPGNVRELEQVLRGAEVRAKVAGRKEILREDIDFSNPAIESGTAGAPAVGGKRGGLPRLRDRPRRRREAGHLEVLAAISCGLRGGQARGVEEDSPEKKYV